MIIGSGAGAKLAAWEFAGSGQRVAVIERKYIGGSCPNIACLPSKNVIHSAEIVHRARQAAEFGANGNTAVDMSAVRARKRRMVDGLVSVHLDIFRSTGTELILGQARFIGPKIVEVTEPNGDKRILQGTNILIGTGTHATLGGVSGLAEAKPLTHIEALELDTLAERVLATKGEISEADLKTAKAAGLSEGEIAEVIAHVALNVFTNYFNVATDVDIDFPKVSHQKLA